ncbi:MAG TPA: histidine phosphatase family protein [Polyangiaceae bacterium]|nr:histidine phosphatase family protein [Polyangiaceae bacterium]
MDVLLIRHGQSVGNAEGRMQGQLDYPLTEAGEQQGQALAAWLGRQAISWQAAYVSPQVRALRTYQILQEQLGAVAPQLDPDLRELHAGELEGKVREEIELSHPSFFERDVTQVGSFAEFGGESYEDVQARVARVWARIFAAHRSSEDCVAILSHGGFLYQLMKAAICVPVPRVAILRFGNCCTSKMHFRDRRGAYMGEVQWHVPIELMGGVATANVSRFY